MNNKELAIKLYDTYTQAVGGVNYNGEPLPTGADFFADETKANPQNGWLAVAREASSCDMVRALLAEHVRKHGTELVEQYAKDRPWVRVVWAAAGAAVAAGAALMAASCTPAHVRQVADVMEAVQTAHVDCWRK